MSKRKGSALLFVLGIIAVLSAVVGLVAEFSMAQLKPRASASITRELRRDAFSALNATIAILKEYETIDGGIFSDLQGWSKPFEDGRFTLPFADAKVVVKDESGKIPFASLTSTNLKDIFEEWGVSSVLAQEAADSILDWCDTDDAKNLMGAEYDDYQRQEPRPPNRQMKSFSELQFINGAKDVFFTDGIPNDLYKKFTSAVSLENFSKTNLNCASENTLEMLCIMNNEDYDADLYKAIRGETGLVSEGKFWVESFGEIESRGARYIPRKNTDVKPQLLSIEITIKRGIAEYFMKVYYGVESASTTNTSRTSVNTQQKQSTARSTGKNQNTNKVQGAKTSRTGNTSRTSKNNTSPKASSMKVLKLYERGI